MVKGAVLAAFAVLAAHTAVAAPTVRALVEMTDISGVSTSPDGRWVVFRQDTASIALDRRLTSWWVIDLARGGPPRKLADGGDVLWSSAGTVVAEQPQWSPDSGMIYFRALVDGQVQIWRASLASGQARAVTHDDANVLSFRLTDARHLSYQVGATREQIQRDEARQRDEGVRIDQSIDVAQNLFDAVEIDGRMASQRLSGGWFDRAGLLADQPPRGRRLDLGSGEVSADNGSASATLSLDERSSSSLLWISGDGFGQVEVSHLTEGDVVMVRRADGLRRLCQARSCRGLSVTSALWRPGHDEVLVTYRDAKLDQGLALWNVSKDRFRILAPPTGALNGGRSDQSCSLTAKQAICVSASASIPPRLVAIDLDSARAITLAKPNQDLDPKPAKVELLTWTTPAGQAFTGRLFLPTRAVAGRPSPLFITYYNCGGYLRGGTGDEWPLSILADKGIAALCINQARRPKSSDPHAQNALSDSAEALDGVEAAVNVLEARGLIDRRRVGMGGLSFGSEQTVWIATHSNLLSAASIASGQMEPVYYWMNGIPGRDNHQTLKRVWGLGAPDETPTAWKTYSAALNTDRFKAPLLMQLPEQEYRFTPELFARLAASTTPVELYVFAGEPHIKVRPRHRLAVYDRNIDWFRFWLQGYEDPDPAKHDQYARWRAMALRRDGIKS